MTKSSGTILAGAGRPEGRGTGTAPFNIYAASVALLWTTALRAAAPPRDPRQAIGHGKRRQGRMRLLAGRDVVDGASRKASNP
jgi:hypothetical protein